MSYTRLKLPSKAFHLSIRYGMPDESIHSAGNLRAGFMYRLNGRVKYFGCQRSCFIPHHIPPQRMMVWFSAWQQNREPKKFPPQPKKYQIRLPNREAFFYSYKPGSQMKPGMSEMFASEVMPGFIWLCGASRKVSRSEAEANCPAEAKRGESRANQACPRCSHQRSCPVSSGYAAPAAK